MRLACKKVRRGLYSDLSVRGANELRGETVCALLVKKSAGRVLKFRRFYKCHRIRFIAKLKILSLVDSYQLVARRSRSGRGLINSNDNMYV